MHQLPSSMYLEGTGFDEVQLTVQLVYTSTYAVFIITHSSYDLSPPADLAISCSSNYINISTLDVFQELHVWF